MKGIIQGFMQYEVNDNFSNSGKTYFCKRTYQKTYVELVCVICCFVWIDFFVYKQSNNKELFRVLRQPILHECFVQTLLGTFK